MIRRAFRGLGAAILLVVAAWAIRRVLDAVAWRVARRLDAPALVTWYYRHLAADRRTHLEV